MSAPAASQFTVPPRHVVITGASSGIGAALARYYARSGTRLSLLARDAARLESVAQGCRSSGAVVETRTGDVTDAAAMEDWLLACDARAPIDLLFANAGIGGGAALALEAGESTETATRIVATNMIGVFNTVCPLLPQFARRRRGHIIMIGSLAGFVGLPQAPAYSASKAALRIYADGLRRLIGSKGVRVSIVSPGFVDTPMTAGLRVPKPFLWSAERAARHIARRVERGRASIAFPWPLVLAVRLSALAPANAVDGLLRLTRNFRGRAR